MTTTNLTPPADLDIARLHSPAEVDAWKAQWDAYRESIKADEAAERLKRQAAEARANRILTREEYHQLAMEREAEKQAKEAARQAVEQTKKDEEAAYLASLPEVAEVLEASEFLFLTKCQNWFAKGYTLPDDGISFFLPGCYSVRLHKPSAASKSK